MSSTVQEDHTSPDKKEHKINLFIWVLLIFFAACIIRVILIPPYRHLNTYSDEMRYLDIARSLFYQGSICIRNTPSYYQKILYPILLAPVMFIKNTVTQIQVIGILNAVWVNSTIFPAYLLVRRICRSDKFVLLTVVLTAIFPMMTYSVIFLSENVYLPIGLWLLYVIFRIFGEEKLSNKIRWALIGGILNYLLYLNKEVALMFVISYLLVPPLIWKDKHKKDDILAFGAYIMGFLIMFLLFKLTLFRGLPNSYDNQIGLDAILTPYRFLYFLYCILYNGLFAIVAFGFFPIFVPFLGFKNMEKSQRAFLVYLLLCLITAIGTISYTISVREDLGFASMRQHTRYYAVLFIPFFICFLNWIEANELPDKYSWLKFIMVSFIAASLILCLITTVRSGTGADSTLLRWWDRFVEFINWHIEIISEGAGFSFNIGAILLKFCFAGFIILGAIGIYRHAKITSYCIIGIIFLLFLFDDYSCTKAFRGSYIANGEIATELSELNNFLFDSGGNCLYIISDSAPSADDKLIDTYISYPGLYKATAESVENEILNKGSLSVGSEDLHLITLADHMLPQSFSLNSVDYILLGSDSEFTLEDNGFEYIDEIESSMFKLYKNKNYILAGENSIPNYAY